MVNLTGSIFWIRIKRNILSLVIAVLFIHTLFPFYMVYLMLILCKWWMVADRCFLFGGYLYHAWKSILAIFARPQQHTVEAGHHLCESNLTSQDWKNNWCRSWLAGSLWIIFMPFGCCLLHCCALCIFACENFRSGFQFFTPSPFFPFYLYIFFSFPFLFPCQCLLEFGECWWWNTVRKL